MCCQSKPNLPNFVSTTLWVAKRNLKDMVETGVVNGWDDPRMNTLAGMRRRGYTAQHRFAIFVKW